MKTDVLIIGNSAAGLSAAETIRKYDKEKTITIVSKETGSAYSRVLLPYVLRGKLPHNNIYIRDSDYYVKNNFKYLEDTVVNVDADQKKVVCENHEINYQDLLIATGSNPVKPPIPGIDSDGIFHMWTRDDLENLTPYFEKGKRVTVIGSGFVALQAAWSAVSKGLSVTVLELAERIMPNVIDSKGSEVLSEKVKEFGVDLRIKTQTQRIEKNKDGSFTLHLAGQEAVDADFIIVGTGVKPNTSFLKNTRVEIQNGICVDPFMKTNIEHVFAAGDVAGGPTAFGDEHEIHALWPTAIEMGQVAGMNILGKNYRYEGSLNMNVTQMYDVTVASIGQFSDCTNYDHHFMPESCGTGYMKVSAKDDQIMGACLIGNTSAMKMFGMLRPVIRLKKKMKIDLVNLERDLQKVTFGLAH